MVAHSIPVHRPNVVALLGKKLTRPSEAVLDFLERKPTPFAKEHGEVVVP